MINEYKTFYKGKNNLKEKGITLIALVVTIIILLILTGVTLNMALSDNGLFSKAEEAIEKYKKAEEDEEDALNKLAEKLENVNIDYNDYIGAYVDGYEPKNNKECVIETTTSGSATSQTFTTEDMKWRIWDYDGKTIRLISEKPTEKTLTLKGANGYNNGVWAINEIAKQCYGQYEEDKITEKNGIKVANLTRSDIQKVSNYDYTEYKHKPGDMYWVEEFDESEGQIKFGEEVLYQNANTKRPAIWELNDKNWTYTYKNSTKTGKDKECLIYEEGEVEELKSNNKMASDKIIESESLNIKESLYTHNYKDKESEFKNKKYYEMIFTINENATSKKYHWLAGRSVHCTETQAYFTVCYIEHAADGNIWLSGGWMYGSKGDSNEVEGLLRPIISIDLESSGYSLEKVIGSDGVVSFNLR